LDRRYVAVLWARFQSADSGPVLACHRCVRSNGAVLKERLRIWLMALRPISFTASVIPVARRHSHRGATRVSRALVHLGSGWFGVDPCRDNLVNDYFDHVKGADNAESLGQSGVIQRGLLSPRAVLREALGRSSSVP